MYPTRIAIAITIFFSIISAHPTSYNVNKRVDTTKVGYLGVYWNTANESVYFSLSNNDNPVDFKPLKNGMPIIIPTKGTKAIRDTSIIAGAGDDAGKKWWIIGTDLDIDQTNWDASGRTGSRGIFVWESTDLINWTNERLVIVEDETAGMVWAPDAVWDPAEGKYLVHWASKFYDPQDTGHSGDPTTALLLRSAYTTDFTTFSQPTTYIEKSTDILDLAFLPVDQNTFIRYYADAGGPVAEVSTTGLHGQWTRPSGIIAKPYEGPYAYWDNVEEGKAWLLNDLVGGNAGLQAWSTTDVKSGAFTEDNSSDITFMRHCSVVPVTQEQYDGLLAL